MTYLTPLLTLFLVDLTAAVSPGPNFLLVSATSMRSGRKNGIAAVLGILSANLVWIAGSLLGLSLLFELVPWLYGTLKIAGGIYLVYLGVQYWRSPSRAEASERHHAIGYTAFWRGFMTGITNPKSLVYFGSIFTLFVGPSSPLWVEVVAGAIVLLNGLAWYGGVALFLGSANVQRAYLTVERPLSRAAGVLIGAFGARLLWERE